MLIQDSAPVLYYALLDCAAHDDAYGTLTTAFPDVRWRSLFENTPEAHLESSAPLLIELDAEAPTPGLREWLLALERQASSVSWIESRYSLPGLCAMLTSRLPCTINDDQQVVLRFYDPRTCSDYQLR